MGTLKKVIAEIELDKLFNVFNSKFFNDEIKKPIIAVQTNGRDKLVMGWCTTKKCWSDKDKGEEYYEITICAEYLFRDIKEICATLLHEMVHLHNVQNGVKDVSRGETYHNKRFKENAEKCGLSISYNKRIGWSVTKLNDEGVRLVSSLNIDENAFTLIRKSNLIDLLPPTGGIEGIDDMPTEPKPKQSYRKYICPKCKIIVRATKDVNVVCGDCCITLMKT